MNQPLIEKQNQPIPTSLNQETVLEVNHWTKRLFSLRISRPKAFRFRSGEFVMLGLFKNDTPLLRPYSITSPCWEETLEFLSIKVPQGPLTSYLQHIQPGDNLLLGKKTTGTLTLDSLRPGERLYLFSTGTGIAPFASLIRDPETYSKFDKIILTHTCRSVGELDYGKNIIATIKNDPLVGELTRDSLVYFSSVTQDHYDHVGRITTFINNGELFRLIGESPLSPSNSRSMICGSLGMARDISAILEQKGFSSGSNAKPAEFVIERAFVD